MTMCADCGHPFECHGDRAVAACVPESIRGWMAVGSMGALTPIHYKCWCFGWRPPVEHDERLVDAA